MGQSDGEADVRHGGPLLRTDVLGIDAWANGDTLMWKVSHTTWALVTGAGSLDAALDLAGSLQFVEEAAWQERYDVEPPEFATREQQEAAVAPAG